MKKKILVVDDEPAILRSTELLLRDFDFDVATTSEASAIIPAIQRERPHVLLQDVRMPGLDVDDLVRRIRADPAIAATPVLLFSASMDLEEIHARVGAQGILEKPFRPHDLTRAIEEAMMKTPTEVA